MTVKERTKYAAKGVITITQLSYGYRPRRRKRTRPDAERSAKTAKLAKPAFKNDHKLRALAIKKKQIHVVAPTPMKLDGIPVFLDVEGMPDRDFYYLVGLQFESGGKWVERSFWADDPDDERLMWENCLQALKAVGGAQIISYGAYETRFLRRMRERYILPAGDMEIVDRIIATSINLVGYIYGRIYFPTYSNSLKEVGRYLGHEWTWPGASGAAAPLLRRAWELGADNHFKLDLIGYNMDDCRAAASVTNALLRINSDSKSNLNEVDVSSLEIGFQRTFGKLILPCQNLRRSITQPIGTISGLRCTHGATRRSGALCDVLNAGTKMHRLSGKSQFPTCRRGVQGAVQRGFGLIAVVHT